MTNKGNKKMSQKLKKYICPDCKGEYLFNPENQEYENEDGERLHFYYSELADTEICEGCEQSDTEHASTIVRYDGLEKEAVRFGNYVAFELKYGDVPDWFWKYFDKRKWHSTSAWRGYYQTKWKNGFVKIADGWVTSWPSESVKHKIKAIELNQFLQDLAENGEAIPAPIFWVFEPTSNVFSTASEIFCNKKDLPVISNWLEKHGFELEAIKESFH